MFFSTFINIVNCAKTIMPYRDRTEIICQILDIANGAEGITRVKVMYKAFISFKQAKEYLTLLTGRDLISYDTVTQTYTTTEKGVTFVQGYNQMDKKLKEYQS
jgi:predicted transcriptional regulator